MSACPRSSAAARCSSDHSAQAGSLVKMSSRTFESTSVPTANGSAIAAGQRHDLVGAHRDGAAAAHGTHDLRAPSGLRTDQARTVAIELEVHLGTRLDAEPATHLARDRHLSFARHTHEHEHSRKVIPDGITHHHTGAGLAESNVVPKR